MLESTGFSLARHLDAEAARAAQGLADHLATAPSIVVSLPDAGCLKGNRPYAKISVLEGE